MSCGLAPEDARRRKTISRGCMGDPGSREILNEAEPFRSKYFTVADPIVALAATLKTLTAGCKTILGGIGLTGSFNHDGLLTLQQLLEGCQIHAKIITIDSPCSDTPCFPLLMKCSRSDVQEIQIWEMREEFEEDGEKLVKSKKSFVKNIWFHMDDGKVPEKNLFLGELALSRCLGAFPDPSLPVQRYTECEDRELFEMHNRKM